MWLGEEVFCWHVLLADVGYQASSNVTAKSLRSDDISFNNGGRTLVVLSTSRCGLARGVWCLSPVEFWNRFASVADS